LGVDPLVGQILKWAVPVEIACKHLANPARAHLGVVPQLDALVVPAGDQLVEGDAERASHQQHLVEPGLAQAGLKPAGLCLCRR
jgi:hypothetical protein